MTRCLILLLLACLVAGCRAGRTTPSAMTPAPVAPGSSAPSTLTPPPIAPAAPVSSPTPAPAACGYGPATPVARLANRDVREASGLVASARFPGAYWTLNDSGGGPLLYAFDSNGHDLGTFRVENAQNEDWETLQLGPAADGGSALYIGDLGNNRGIRREWVIYRVPEPDLGQAAEKPSGRPSLRAEILRFTYASGSPDAEAMLVHPRTGEIALITKEYAGQARVHQLPPPLDPASRARAELVAELDLRHLGPFLGAVTDAALSPDGRRAVLRTYGTALEYDLPNGAALASIWGQQPRSYPLDDGPQGEGITYRADGLALMTIGETVPAVLHQAARRC